MSLLEIVLYGYQFYLLLFLPAVLGFVVRMLSDPSELWKTSRKHAYILSSVVLILIVGSVVCNFVFLWRDLPVLLLFSAGSSFTPFLLVTTQSFFYLIQSKPN